MNDTYRGLMDIQCREVSKRLDAREEEVGAASHSGEGRQAGDCFADRTLWDFEFERAVLSADDRVAFVTELVKVSVVSPYILGKLELSDKACTDDESRYAAVGAIIWSVYPAKANHK